MLQALNKIDPILWKTISQPKESAIWKNAPQDHDDWNTWWKKQFDNYSFLSNRVVTNYIEIGCGPYAKNTVNILNTLSKQPETIYLNDPLIMEYLKENKSIAKLVNKNTSIVPTPLEEINLECQMDCVVCINVLDHVYDLDLCLEKLYSITATNGIIILGQDLTDNVDHMKNKQEDFDYTHPIRFDLAYLEEFLSKFQTIYRKVLDRADGRNPNSHYATLLYCGEKI